MATDSGKAVPASSYSLMGEELGTLMDPCWVPGPEATHRQGNRPGHHTTWTSDFPGRFFGS
eukprot:8880776-Alexandrium_andersonii.AAC.1